MLHWPVSLKLAEESAGGRGTERCDGGVITLRDLLLRGRRRQAAAGGRLVEREQRHLAVPKGGLQLCERAGGRGVDVENGHQSRRQRAPEGRHGLGVHDEVHGRILIAAAQQGGLHWRPGAAQVVHVEVLTQSKRRLDFGDRYARRRRRYRAVRIGGGIHRVAHSVIVIDEIRVAEPQLEQRRLRAQGQGGSRRHRQQRRQFARQRRL